MKEFMFKGYNDFELNAREYEIKNPKGIVQIIHGMQEYCYRYDSFAKFLNENGYAVFINDLRGHGYSIKGNEPQGYSSGDISKENIADQILISEYLKNKYKNIPLIVFGHSYGSFLTQNYITQCNLADKVVLSGSAYTNTLLMKLGKVFANITALFKGKKTNAKMIENMSFKTYSKGFEDGNWLCRNKDVWDEYKSNEFCGKPFPANFYKSFFKMVLSNYKHLDKINKNLPIFIMSGENDPVGEKGKQVKKLYEVYKTAGLNNLIIKLYPEGRHEMLNELNKNEVYKDILCFFDK